MPAHYGRYFEPFLGGGALFFCAQPAEAHLSDINAELIDTYRALQSDVEAVIRGLLSLCNEERAFYLIRAINPASLSLAARAARFIYLNRTCYNGLYRVNRAGQFNAPFGRYERPMLCDADNLRAVAAQLRGHRLVTQSFQALEHQAKRGDFVYFDPPYVPVNKTASFVGYVKHGFDESQQTALAQLATSLVRRGTHVLLSNSDTPLVRKLYAAFHQRVVLVRRNISCLAHHRGPVRELLIAGETAPGLRATPPATFRLGN